MANVIKHKRGSGSDPGASDLILGELAIRTDTGKLFTKMDSGAIAEIAGGGSDIAINTLSSSSGTGGGSATFNGSAYRFTLSQPPNVSAAQLLVSINGVIQKPVAGTGQPSEGFSVDGTDIILGDAPATGSDFFILTFKSLGVSEPADNSVTSAKIVDGAIVNADINASAAIAGTKISPDFGSQNIITTGNITTTGDLTVGGTYPAINLYDSNNNPDWRIQNNNGMFAIFDQTNGANRVQINTDGHIDLLANVDISNGLDVTGAITGTSDLTIDTNTFHVDASDNRVGIGTTSPATILHISQTNPELRIQGTNGNGGVHKIFSAGINSESLQLTGASNLLFNADTQFFRSSDEGTEYMRIDSSGRVGIGVTSPSSKLHINCGSDNTAVQINSTDAGSFYQAIDNTGESVFGHSGANAIISVDPGASVSSSAIVFQVDANSEKMRIDSSGRVGIGMSNHNSYNSVADDLIIAQESGDCGITIRSGTTHLGGIFFTDTADTGFRGGVRYDHSGDYMRIDTNLAERMRIDSSGRLIVGATSGAGKFIVQDSSLPKIQANFNGTAHLESGVGGSGGGFAITTGHFLTFNHQPYANRGTDTNLTERMRILSDGAVCINATSRPVVGTEFLGVQGGSASNSVGIAAAVSHNEGIPFFASNSSNSFADRLMRFAAGSGGDVRGTIIFNGSAMVYGGTSDYRLKENITSISDGITKLKSLNPINFNWIKDETNTNIMGFLAHEVQAVMPEAVAGKKDAVDSKGKEDYQEMDYGRITPLIVAALQEAIARIEALEAK